METAPEVFSDFDFHPDEPHVRQFQIPQSGVLRIDEQVFVSEAESDGIVLRHYAFADEWFKINVTIDRGGTIVETDLAPPAIPKSFAYNCDISTPMQLGTNAVYATDLFLDVLVRKDGVSHQVVDLDEFNQAIADQLISEKEATHARSGLDRLLTLITNGHLFSFLNEAYPLRPLNRRPNRRRTPHATGACKPGQRSTW